MDITKWGDIASIVASPVGSLVLAFFVWKLSEDVKDMKKAMYENGFLTHRDMEEERARAQEIHKRQDDQIDRNSHDIERLRNRMEA